MSSANLILLVFRNIEDEVIKHGVNRVAFKSRVLLKKLYKNTRRRIREELAVTSPLFWVHNVLLIKEFNLICSLSLFPYLSSKSLWLRMTSVMLRWPQSELCFVGAKRSWVTESQKWLMWSAWEVNISEVLASGWTDWDTFRGNPEWHSLQ